MPPAEPPPPSDQPDWADVQARRLVGECMADVGSDGVAETDTDEMAVDKHPEYSKSRLFEDSGCVNEEFVRGTTTEERKSVTSADDSDSCEYPPSLLLSVCFPFHQQATNEATTQRLASTAKANGVAGAHGLHTWPVHREQGSAAG